MWSKHWVRAEKKLQVLDIGSEHNFHPPADAVVDFEVGESSHQSGKVTRTDKRRCFIIVDSRSLPFNNRAFDYILTLHTVLFCEELIMTGKRGYIETPSKLCKRLSAELMHEFLVYREVGTLIFEIKRNPAATKWFYGLFYYGREHVGHPNIIPPNRVVHLFLNVINFVILRLWYLRAIRERIYICFEWEHSFKFKVES